jgi:hypothetical protein
MRAKLNRNTCHAHLAYCEQFLGEFLRFPMGYEKRCFEEIEDDGSELLTLEITSGEYTRTFVLDEKQREEMAAAGWAYFVDFPVPIYRNENP